MRSISYICFYGNHQSVLPSVDSAPRLSEVETVKTFLCDHHSNRYNQQHPSPPPLPLPSPLLPPPLPSPPLPPSPLLSPPIPCSGIIDLMSHFLLFLSQHFNWKWYDWSELGGRDTWLTSPPPLRAEANFPVVRMYLEVYDLLHPHLTYPSPFWCAVTYPLPVAASLMHHSLPPPPPPPLSLSLSLSLSLPLPLTPSFSSSPEDPEYVSLQNLAMVWRSILPPLPPLPPPSPLTLSLPHQIALCYVELKVESMQKVVGGAMSQSPLTIPPHLHHCLSFVQLVCGGGGGGDWGGWTVFRLRGGYIYHCIIMTSQLMGIMTSS